MIDDKGRIISKSVESFDNEAGETLIRKSEMGYTYTEGKGISQCQFSFDTDADGSPNYASKRVWTLGENGMTDYEFFFDEKGTGEFKKINGYSHVYGDQAEMTTDGDNEKTFSYSETDVVNGARYLITEYQEFERGLFHNEKPNSFLCPLGR